jgi:DNA-binding MarR family transcriptional regulator
MSFDIHPAPPSLGPELDFLRLLWRIDHAMQQRSKRMARELGPTGPQRLVLRLVGRFPGLPARELADLLHLDPGTLSGILRRLERAGWLRRRNDPRDRRRVMLGLTEEGRALDTSDPITVEHAVGRALSDTKPSELLAARALLERVARELERSESGIGRRGNESTAAP